MSLPKTNATAAVVFSSLADGIRQATERHGQHLSDEMNEQLKQAEDLVKSVALLLTPVKHHRPDFDK